MKSKKGRPEVDSEAVNVRMKRDFIVAIDDWRREQPGLPSRPEAIRRLLSEALAVHVRASPLK